MLNKFVIALLLFAGLVLVSLSTVGNFDGTMSDVAFNYAKVLP